MTDEVNPPFVIPIAGQIEQGIIVATDSLFGENVSITQPGNKKDSTNGNGTNDGGIDWMTLLMMGMVALPSLLSMLHPQTSSQPVQIVIKREDLEAALARSEE